jgi:hypothetical protein
MGWRGRREYLSGRRRALLREHHGIDLMHHGQEHQQEERMRRTGLQIRRPEAGKYNLELELAGTGDGEVSGRKGGGSADKEEDGGGAAKRERALATLGSERGRRRGR